MERQCPQGGARRRRGRQGAPGGARGRQCPQGGARGRQCPQGGARGRQCPQGGASARRGARGGASARRGAPVPAGGARGRQGARGGARGREGARGGARRDEARPAPPCKRGEARRAKGFRGWAKKKPPFGGVWLKRRQGRGRRRPNRSKRRSLLRCVGWIPKFLRIHLRRWNHAMRGSARQWCSWFAVVVEDPSPLPPYCSASRDEWRGSGGFLTISPDSPR
jgi:hypothetical protein